MGNRPRIITTNKRMDGGIFVNSLSIRGWSLGAAKVNALRELQSPSFLFGDALQSVSGEELSHRDAAQSALMPSILDKAFKGEL